MLVLMISSLQSKVSMSETADTIHILHVDDDPDLADLAATFLECRNDQLDVQTATSPSEGLNFETYPPD